MIRIASAFWGAGCLFAIAALLPFEAEAQLAFGGTTHGSPHVVIASRDCSGFDPAICFDDTGGQHPIQAAIDHIGPSLNQGGDVRNVILVAPGWYEAGVDMYVGAAAKVVVQCMLPNFCTPRAGTNFRTIGGTCESLCQIRHDGSDGDQIGINIANGEKYFNGIGCSLEAGTDSDVCFRIAADAGDTIAFKDVTITGVLANSSAGFVQEHPGAGGDQILFDNVRWLTETDESTTSSAADIKFNGNFLGGSVSLRNAYFRRTCTAAGAGVSSNVLHDGFAGGLLNIYNSVVETGNVPNSLGSGCLYNFLTLDDSQGGGFQVSVDNVSFGGKAGFGRLFELRGSGSTIHSVHWEGNSGLATWVGATSDYVGDGINDSVHTGRIELGGALSRSTRFCSAAGPNGSMPHYMGPDVQDGGPANLASCHNGLFINRDSAVEADANQTLFNRAIRTHAIYCEITAGGVNDTVTFQLRADGAPVEGVACSVTMDGTNPRSCSQSRAVLTTVASGAELAVEVVAQNDDLSSLAAVCDVEVEVQGGEL